MTSGVAFVGAPYDGAATLGWPGARYAPDEFRRHLAWMRMRVQDGHIYWVDQDRVVPWAGTSSTCSSRWRRPFAASR
jgi:hypothetical protein